jgi:hypothetical protein
MVASKTVTPLKTLGLRVERDLKHHDRKTKLSSDLVVLIVIARYRLELQP